MGGRSRSSSSTSTSSIIDNSAYTRSDTQIDNRIYSNDLSVDALGQVTDFASGAFEDLIGALDAGSERDQEDRSNVLSTATDLVRAQAQGEEGRTRLAVQTATGGLASEGDSMTNTLALAAVGAVAAVAWVASR